MRILNFDFGNSRRKTCLCFLSLSLSSVMITSIASLTLAENKPPSSASLADRSLEDLLTMEVTSVSKRATKLSDSAAAIYVITQEDIRRSGLNSIPELLRLAPGLQVSKIDANNWSVGSRGFSSQFSDKLLVLMDGRSVYNPLFSGVWWNTQDTLIDDIERIEIIRGPGATLWGANAVNGVINIVTKNASQTVGGLTYAGACTADQVEQEGIRYGGTAGNGVNYRFYAKSFEHGNNLNAEGASNQDTWDQRRGGFRMDLEKSDTNSMTFQGDAFETNQSMSAFSGSNLLFRSAKVFSNSDRSNLQIYFDRTEMNSPIFASEERNTIDLDYQHCENHFSNQQIIWGVGYRQSKSSLANGPIVNFDKLKRTDKLFSAFAQEEINLKSKLLKITFGSKIEHNDYTGFEIQPNIRALWTPTPDQTVWAAVSRAVRTPSVAEYDAHYRAYKIPVPDGLDILPVIDGNPGFHSEILLARELGYRIDFGKGLSVDAAAFYNLYSELRSYEPQAPVFSAGPPPYLTMASTVDNKLSGTSRGIEIVADWNVTSRWKLAATCSWIAASLDRSASQDVMSAGFEDLAPSNQINLNSYWTLPGDLEIDAMLLHVAKCTSYSPAGQGVKIPAYTRMDIRVGKRFGDNYRMSLGVRNALDARHSESGSIYGAPSEIERNVYCTLTRSF